MVALRTNGLSENSTLDLRYHYHTRDVCQVRISDISYSLEEYHQSSGLKSPCLDNILKPDVFALTLKVCPRYSHPEEEVE
ncbi:hypothetical protein ACHWQZ_G017869 [Mnemiopsis leidyi]